MYAEPVDSLAGRYRKMYAVQPEMSMCMSPKKIDLNLCRILYKFLGTVIPDRMLAFLNKRCSHNSETQFQHFTRASKKTITKAWKTARFCLKPITHGLNIRGY